MTNQLEALITSEIADFFACFVEIHVELGGPNTIEETQQQLTQRVTRIASECESALEQSQQQNKELQTKIEATEAVALALRDDSRSKDKRIAELEASSSRLRAERDALREQELHKATNTRAAADIYFQLIEECEIPPGGSLVQHVDDLKERVAELEGFKTAYMEWSDKTDWVQKAPAGRFGFNSLGMHLADVMTRHIEQLEASQKAVKLPGVGGVESTTIQSIRDYADGWKAYREEAIKMLAAAGITVQGEE